MKKQLTHIQGVRGILIILIVLFHLFPQYCPNGFLGVDVFFVISGYFLLGKQLADGSDFHLPSFIKNKCGRLLQPYFFTVFFSIIIGILIFPAADILQADELVKGTLLCMCNDTLQGMSSGYFAVQTRSYPLMHMWYMGVLLQCYLFFALLFTLWQLFRVPGRFRLLLSVIICLGSFIFAHQGLYGDWWQNPVNTYYLTTARIWEFVLGGILYRLPPVICNKSNIIALTAIGALILLSFIPIENSYQYVGIGAVIGALIIRYGAVGITNNILSTKIFICLGSISFSLYLVHWPLICFAEYIFCNQVPLWGYFVLIIIIFIFAILAYHTIEKPRFSLWLIAILWVTMFGLQTLTLRTRGFHNLLHQRINTQFQELRLSPQPAVAPDNSLLTGSDGIAPNQSSPQEKKGFLLLNVGDLSQPVSFVIMGDSHAGDVTKALHYKGCESGWHGVFLNSYVVPFWNADYRKEGLPTAPGNFFNENKAVHIISWLRAHPELKYVIIAQYWRYRFVPHVSWQGQNIEQNIIKERLNELRAFCEQIKLTGKEIIIFTDTPEISETNPRRVARSYAMYSMLPQLPQGMCYTQKEYSNTDGYFNSMLESLQDEGLCTVIHREDAFFENPACSALRNGKSIFRDSHHLTIQGSLLSISKHTALLEFLLGKQNSHPDELNCDRHSPQKAAVE